MKTQPTTSISLLLLVGAVSLLLGACSSVNQAPAALDQSSAREVATVLAQGDLAVLSMFQGGFSLGAMGVATTRLTTLAEASCVTMVPDPAVDGDADGIPLTQTTTFACSQATDGMDASGSVTLSDADDTDATSGYDQHIDHLALSLSGDGDTDFSMSFDGDLSLRRNLPTYTLDAAFTFAFHSGSEGGSLSLDVHPTYTPTDPAAPFAGGTFTLDGTISVASGGETYTLTRTSSGLTFSQDCSVSFTSGSVTYLDSAGNDLTITYTGCGSYSATFNHQALSF